MNKDTAKLLDFEQRFLLGAHWATIVLKWIYFIRQFKVDKS